MPVDLASGAVFSASDDFRIAGSKPIVWRRIYSSDSEFDGPLGHGWITPYLMRLNRRTDGLGLLSESGGTILFASDGGALTPGNTLFNFGARMELSLTGEHYVILHWHDGGDPVERFGFSASTLHLEWMETVEGHRVQLRYDESGRLLRLEQWIEQRVVEFTYHEEGLIDSIWQILASGRRSLLTQYRYDSRRNLTEHTDALGYTKQYTYNSAHRITAERNVLGATFSFDYDAKGRCIHCSGDGHYMERTISYSTVPRITTVTNTAGYIRQYLFSAAAQLLQETAPTGAAETYSYDGEGRLVAVTHADGSTRQLQFDALGNRTSIVDERGSKIKVAFNRLHRPISLIDSKDGEYKYSYNNRGALIAYTNPVGATWTYVRDARSLLIETRYPSGRIVRQNQDSKLRWVEAEDNTSLLQRVEYGEAGEVLAVTAVGGARRSYEYDALQRPTRIRYEDGTERMFQWNAAGALLSRRGPADETDDFTYDQFGHLIANRNSASDVMRLQYDNEGRLSAVVNRAGESLERQFGPGGKISREKLFDGRTIEYKYDLRNFLTERLISERPSTIYVHDPGGNLIARVSSGITEEFAYDENGELIGAKNHDSELFFERDAVRRITAEVQNGRRVEYDYDAEGHCIARRLPWASRSDLGFDYDVRGRMTDLKDQDGKFQHFAWDSDDRLVQRSCPDGLVETLESEIDGTIIGQVVRTANGSVAVSRKYEYDERGNVARFLDGNEGWSSYRYDKLNRLVSVSRADGSREDFRYDEIGRILSGNGQPRQPGPGGQTRNDGARTLHYDAFGNVQEIHSGRTIEVLDFDGFGRLGKSRTPDTVAVYRYDALGRRVSKETPEEKTEFVWDSSDLAGVLVNGKLTKTFYFRNGELIAEWDDKVRRVPISDRSATVRELFTPNGAVVWRGTYSTYGLLRTSSGLGSNNFRFRGQYHDSESGLAYNFYRYYDPLLGDYVSADPIGLSGGCNFYAYSRNPLTWDDPFGLTCGKPNKQHGDETEQEMHEYFEGKGFLKISTDGRARGIDGVYVNTNPPPNDQPPFIIAEGKYNTSPLGTTKYSGDQMGNQWIGSEIGKPTGGQDRLSAALGGNPQPGATAADVTAGGADKYVYRQPAGGGPPVVTKVGTYP